MITKEIGILFPEESRVPRRFCHSTFEDTLKISRKLNDSTSFSHCSPKVIVGRRFSPWYTFFDPFLFSSKAQLREVIVFPVPVAIAKMPLLLLPSQFLYASSWYSL